MISPFWHRVQRELFHVAEECVGPLTEDHKRVLVLLEAIGIEQYVRENRRARGRPGYSVKACARAFLVKSILNLSETKCLVRRLELDLGLRRICGFEGKAPSESKLSRMFAAFSENAMLREGVLADQVRNHVGEMIVPHVARDATAIEVREKAGPKPKKPKAEKRKRGPKKPGDAPALKTRMELQVVQSWEEALGELPIMCDVGAKLNSSGHMSYWRGYKLHPDVADHGLPLSICLTSASLHDSQAAIPLMKMTSTRTKAVLYSLMDAGYLGGPIVEVSKELGHVPLVDQRTGKDGYKAKGFDPAEQGRYQSRTVVERFFSTLKDNHLGQNIRVRGYKKVMTHIMFAVLAVFASVVIRL